MNTTDEYWTVNGTSLNVPGWNISTLGGRFTVPPLRGEDITYAYVPGEQPGTYLPGSRVLTFQMWMIGANPTTGDMSVDQRRMWNDNWKFLTRLFWEPREELTIVRKLLLTDPDTEAGYIQTTTCRGRYAGGLDAQMTGRTRATFTVDVKLADPFFWGDEIETTIEVGDTEVITNPGDFTAGHKNFTVELHGALTRPTLTNFTTNPDVWVHYENVISSGQSLTLDTEAYTAVASAPEVSIPEISLNRVGYISYSGAHSWMGLKKGANTLGLSAVSGDGHAIVRFRPPYL